jgi:hypothetical protein
VLGTKETKETILKRFILASAYACLCLKSVVPTRVPTLIPTKPTATNNLILG